MAKRTFPKDADGRTAINVTERVNVGIARFFPGRLYRVDDETLASLGDKARPAVE